MDISAYTEKSRSYLEQINEKVRRSEPARLAARVETLVREQDSWREQCLNLNPAESLMSRRSRAVLNSDMATRLTEGIPGDKLYPHGRSNEKFDEIEATIISLAQVQFGAKYVEWRPVSTTMANAAVFYSLLGPGDVMLSKDEDAGGNYVYQHVGPASLAGAQVLPIPSKGEAFEFDLEKLEEAIDRTRPRLIAIGGSNVLFPYPLHEMRRMADRVGAFILYDAAHVSLLVSCGDLQRPLEEGADVLTFSTQKILGGPVGGMVLTNDSSIADRVARLVFPRLLQTRDLNKLSALAIAMAENAAYGAERARQSVTNAQALAAALEQEGFKLLARDRGYTRTHQIFLKLGDKAREFETRCNNANIMLTDCGLTGDMAKGLRSGSRLGTHEVTRLGMNEAEMKTIARLIRRAAEGEDSASLCADVEELVSGFPAIGYSFDDQYD